MLKKNDGYFLSETIIGLTVVATIITILYVGSMSYYIKQNNNITKFNTVQGLYSIKEVKKYYLNNPVTQGENGLLYDSSNNNNDFFDNLDINKVYYTDYNISGFDFSEIPASIRKELKKIDIDNSEYEKRYIVIFNDYSYATIGINE